MESRRNGPQLSSRHDDDDDDECLLIHTSLILQVANDVCTTTEKSFETEYDILGFKYSLLDQ